MKIWQREEKYGPGMDFTQTSDTETQLRVNQIPSVQGSTGSDLVKSKRTWAKMREIMVQTLNFIRSDLVTEHPLPTSTFKLCMTKMGEWSTEV